MKWKKTFTNVQITRELGHTSEVAAREDVLVVPEPDVVVARRDVLVPDREPVGVGEGEHDPAHERVEDEHPHHDRDRGEHRVGEPPLVEAATQCSDNRIRSVWQSNAVLYCTSSEREKAR